MSKSRVERIYAKRARKYDRLLGKKYNERLQEFVRDFQFDFPFGKSESLFEAGGGTGIITQVLAERFSKSRIAVMDISPEMLKELRRKMPSQNNLELIVGDFNKPQSFTSFPGRERVRIHNNQYDLVISVGAITEYGDLQIAIPWVYGLLKRNRQLVLLPSRPGLKTAITSRFWAYKPKKPEEVVNACISAGFQDAAARLIDKRYGIIADMKYLVTASKS